MVSRVIRIIEQLAAGPNNPTLADLARATGLPKSSLHRLLAMLTVHGAVCKQGNTYRLGDRLTELTPSQGARSASAVRRLLMPYLTDLYRGTGMIVGLAALAMPDVVLVDTVYGHEHRGAVLLLPERAPAHRTAAGKLLLALRPELLCGYQAGEGPAAEAPTGRGSLDQELTNIRVAGIAVGRGEHVHGMSTIATAVTGRDGKPVAALLVCGPDRDVELTRVTMQLRRAAYAASLAVRGDGHRPTGAGDRGYVMDRPYTQPPPNTNGTRAPYGAALPPLDRAIPNGARRTPVAV